MEQEQYTPMKEPRRTRIKRTSSTLGIVFIGSLVSLILYHQVLVGTLFYSESYTTSSGYGSCNVMGINLHGSLYTYTPAVGDGEYEDREDSVASENILGQIEQAEKDDTIKAILVEVDSPGGYPVAGEEVARAIASATKPVVGLIRQQGTSAAYWAVSSVDRLFGSLNSDIGGIGATMSYVDNVEKNKKEGLSFVELSSGKYKDIGSTDRPLTSEEKLLLMRDVSIIHDNFIKAISTYRTIPLEQVRKIADGSSVLGAQAKELGLIDEIGGYTEAKAYLASQIGEDAEVCW